VAGSSAGDDLAGGVISVSILALLVLLAFFFVWIALGLGVLFLIYVVFRIHQNSDAVSERKAREHIYALYDQAAAIQSAAPSTRDFLRKIANNLPSNLPDIVLKAALETAKELYEGEGFGKDLEKPPIVCASIEGARYQDYLSAFTRKTKDSASSQQAYEAILECLQQLLFHFSLPEEDDDAVALVPITQYIPKLGHTVEQIVLPFYGRENRDRNLFDKLRAQFDRNAYKVSGLPNTIESAQSPKLIFPPDYKGENVVEAYLQGTPLRDLFNLRLPFAIPQKLRFQHHVIVGGTGQGKSVTLERFIARDLLDDRGPSIVVIESQQRLTKSIARLQAFRDRNPIIINPFDAVGLNVFDMQRHRQATYNEHTRDQIYNQTLDVFTYLFNSLLGADLSVRQTALFNNLVALMLKLPEVMGRNATLLDLMRYMDNPAPYAKVVDALPELEREFFQKDFKLPAYRPTQEQIKYRLRAILSNKSLSKLFLSPNSTIDFHEEINRGSVILIDTNKDYLGKTNSGYMGRVSIMLLLKAILERAANPSERPVFVYIDEAGEYFDASIDNFLTEARKYNAGLILAHQHIGQMPADLRASVASNTGIKFAGGVSTNDARILAPDMRTTPDFINAQPGLSFAAYLRNVTPSAISLSFPYGYMEQMPQLSDAEYEAMRADIRTRYSAAAPDPVPDPEELDI
jgi:hypothetical protein